MGRQFLSFKTKASRVDILRFAVGENLRLSLIRENRPRLKSYEIFNMEQM